VNGACGYEALSQQDWPFWDVVSIGPNNPVAYKGNKKGCGYCIKATCQGAVSLSLACTSSWVLVSLKTYLILSSIKGKERGGI
jgi:hypothetical protein